MVCDERPSLMQKLIGPVLDQSAFAPERAGAVTILPGVRGVFWTALILSLFALLYGSVGKGLVLQWWSYPDYGHGFLVPLFSCFVLWRERKSWLNQKIKPNNFGLVV